MTRRIFPTMIAGGMIGCDVPPPVPLSVVNACACAALSVELVDEMAP